MLPAVARMALDDVSRFFCATFTAYGTNIRRLYKRKVLRIRRVHDCMRVLERVGRGSRL